MARCSGHNCEPFAAARERFEVAYLRSLLRRHVTVREAAKAARMDSSTLWRMMKRHGFRPQLSRVWIARSTEERES